ncbi:MAG: hypothetical protein K5989_09730, partial [Lachnospiraceae bacterium]|nr:hypothetical protein [Lachnospiraceae bacterium]
MRDFSQATMADFRELDNILSNGKQYILRDREFPVGCRPDRLAVGFQKEGNTYRVYIKERVETDIKDGDFGRLMERRQITFDGFDKLISFFRSLAPLFQVGTLDAEEGVPNDAVVDRQMLQEIKEQGERDRIVVPDEIAKHLKQQIYGQDEAIDALATGIALNQLDKKRR